MGRRRTKRPQRPQGAEHSARTARAPVAHVPPGRRPCSWCCEGLLTTSPGFFRDFDSDFGSTRYGICVNCAGAGIELGLVKAERDVLDRLRMRRSNIADTQLPRLQQQLTFAQVVIAGRAGVCEVIDRALSALDGAERDEAVQHALVVCARMLDTLFPREEFEHRYERVLHRALEACRCWSDRATLLSFVELVRTLPDARTPEHEELRSRLHALADGHARYTVFGTDPNEYVGDKLVRCIEGGEVLVGRALREHLTFRDGLDALLQTRAWITECAEALAALERGDRSVAAEALTPLWDAACMFAAGVYGDSHISRSKPFLWSDACSCRKYRRRLLAAREAVIALVPEAGTPEFLQLFEAIRPHATRLEAEHNRLVNWVKDPLPYGELQLLLLVRWYWLEAGRPTRCYAERLVQLLEDEFLSPPPPAPRRAIPPEIAAQFQPDEIPTELEGLDGALLADLHDCVSKFGREDHADRVRRYSLREPVEVHVSVSTVAENRTMFIIGAGGQTTSAGAHILRLLRSEPNPAPVIWDQRVRVDDIRAFIAQVDEIMGARGFVHPETGARIAVMSDHPSPKDSVDRTFARPGACVPVFTGGPDAETMRQQFDRPDEVVIMTSSFGVTALHHRRDVPMIQRREEIVKRVLARYGLTTAEQIGDLSFQRIEELRAEVDRAIAAEAS